MSSPLLAISMNLDWLALKSLVLIIIIIFCFMGFICKYSKKEIGIQFGRILSLKEAKRWMRIKKGAHQYNFDALLAMSKK